MAVIMSKIFTLPEVKPAGVVITDLEVGTIVKIPENGQLVEFYIAKHAYAYDMGNTLLVRKDIYSKRSWSGNAVNAYASSDIDTWLNNDYKNLLSTGVQSALTSNGSYIDYTPGNGNDTVTDLNRKIFLLSLTELGLSGTHANTEGSALPIASTLKVAYYNGSASDQWTRTPTKSTTQQTYYVSASGTAGYGYAADSRGVRPAFGISCYTLFNPETKEFMGVA